MTYDSWKTRSPDDELDHGEPPEVWVECPVCQGEGYIEQWESVSRWSIDPPSGFAVLCEECHGAGGAIEDAGGEDRR